MTLKRFFQHSGYASRISGTCMVFLGRVFCRATRMFHWCLTVLTLLLVPVSMDLDHTYGDLVSYGVPPLTAREAKWSALISGLTARDVAVVTGAGLFVVEGLLFGGLVIARRRKAEASAKAALASPKEVTRAVLAGLTPCEDAPDSHGGVDRIGSRQDTAKR